MKCTICGKDDNFFNNEIHLLRDLFISKRKTIDELININIQKRIKYVDITPEKKFEVSTISDDFLTMKISSVTNEITSFIKLEPKLDILVNYYNKIKNSKNILTIGNIKDAYLLEPNNELIPDNFNLNKKIAAIDIFLNSIIEKTNNNFIDINVPLSDIGFDNIPAFILDKSEQDKLSIKINICLMCNFLLKKTISNETTALIDSSSRY